MLQCAYQTGSAKDPSEFRSLGPELEWVVGDDTVYLDALSCLWAAFGPRQYIRGLQRLPSWGRCFVIL